MHRRLFYKFFGTVSCLLMLPAFLSAQSQLATSLQQTIDSIAHDALAKTGVPSASVAVIKDGQIAYIRAYGQAKLGPQSSAKPEMRYSIGSISKQFTAVALLLLQRRLAPWRLPQSCRPLFRLLPLSFAPFLFPSLYRRELWVRG